MQKTRVNAMRQSKLAVSHVAGPVIVCATMGFVVAAGLRLSGFLELPDLVLISSLSGMAGLNRGLEDAPLWAGLLLAAIAVLGVCAAILGSPGFLRRLSLFVTTLVLVAGLCVVAALYAIFLSVIPAVIAVLWGGGCALIYASRHTLPCDAVDPA